MKMRHQPRLFGDQAPQRVVDLDRIERGKPQSRKAGHQREQAPAELSERRLARQIAAEAGDVDAGQYPLAIAACHQMLRLAHDLADRHGPAVAAAVGNDAERAAVIAALLYLDEGASAAFESVDQMRRGF